MATKKVVHRRAETIHSSFWLNKAIQANKTEIGLKRNSIRLEGTVSRLKDRITSKVMQVHNHTAHEMN